MTTTPYKEIEKIIAFQGHNAERRLMEIKTIVRRELNRPLHDITEMAALKQALQLAINSVECASVDPKTKEELPWYRAAKKALAF